MSGGDTCMAVICCVCRGRGVYGGVAVSLKMRWVDGFVCWDLLSCT